MSTESQHNASPLQVTTTSLVEFGAHRVSSRSVSWNCSGFYLGYGSSDRVVRLVTLDSSSASAREVQTISGHSGAVNKVRFHPSEVTQLLTTSTDQTVRLWDFRQSSPKALAMIEGKQAVSTEWGRGDSTGNFIVITERSGKVSVYDRRQLTSSSSSRPAASGSGTPRGGAVPVHVFDRFPQIVDSAIFGPDGHHLIGGFTHRGEGMSDVGVWKWNNKDEKKQSMDTGEEPPVYRFVAHTGPIYSMDLSPNGKRLATGGSDALVGLWDTDTMICTHTLSKPTKFIRSVAFSHDGRMLATCSDENDIFLVGASSGAFLGSVALGHRRGGAEEVAWHPSSHMFACARTEFMTDRPPPPIAVAKIAVAASLQ